MSTVVGLETVELAPDEIITLNDYPLYDMSVFRAYVDKSSRGENLPLVPVIEKDLVKKYINDSLLQKLKLFEQTHPQARYFMLDGSHRTTALTRAGRTISAVVYRSDNDIAIARDTASTGQILKSGTLDLSFAENCQVLDKHFTEKTYFMTVKEKTNKMAIEGLL